MPEIRLGSSESMTNINLGSTEIQEIKLGNILVWRNNVLPFFLLSVNGTEIANLGTPDNPLEGNTPEGATLTNFTYTSNISLQLSMIIDEDIQYPITARFYEGDFGADETLTPLGTTSGLQANSSTTFTIPKGPQPSGANAADFIYNDKLFSVTLTDAEEGVSILYARIARADVVDQWNYTPFVTNVVGSPFSFSSSTSCSVGCSGACYETQGAQILSGTQTTTGTRRTDGQVRTASYQVNGVQDAVQPAQAALTQNVTVTLTSNTGSCSGATSTCNNPGFVASITTETNSFFTTGPWENVGSCIPHPSMCGVNTQTCTNGTQNRRREHIRVGTNCANQTLSSVGQGTYQTGTTSCSYANGNYIAPQINITQCSAGGTNGDIARVRGTGQGRVTVTYNGTCQNGTAFSGQSTETISADNNFNLAANTVCNASNPISTITCACSNC